MRCDKGKFENGSKVYTALPLGRIDMHVKVWCLQAQASFLRFKSRYSGLHCTLAYVSLSCYVIGQKDGPVRPGLTSLLPRDETRRARTGL